MKQIPRKTGQGLNGVGVSVMALVALLFILPLSSSSIIGIAKYIDGDSKTTNFPASLSSTYPNWFRATWESAGDSADAQVNPNLTAISYPLTFTNISGESYHLLDSCLDQSAPFASRCGDDNFRISIYDGLTQDHKSLPVSYYFEAINNVYQCSSSSFATISFDYTFKYRKIKNSWILPQYDGHEEILATGSMKFKNSKFSHTDSAGIDWCFDLFKIDHEFNFEELNILTELKEYSGRNNSFALYIEFEDLYNEDSNQPLSQSNVRTPFEDTGAGPSYYRTQFESLEIGSYGMTTRALVLVLGLVFFVAAIASTPFWDPFKGRLSQ